MSTIRRQSIFSSILIYIGFALGFINTYLFARGFSESQYGLTGTFIAIAIMMFSFSQLGMVSYIYKFFPYYKENLAPAKNDLVTIALITSLTGFVLVAITGVFLKDLVIQKYGTNSPDLVTYYFWLFPFGLGLTLFSVLESYAWQYGKSIVTNFLREIFFRLLTTILIVLYFTGIISSFALFIKLYALTHLITALVLMGYLISTHRLHFTFTISRLTRKFSKKIIALVSFVWGGGLVLSISQVFDTLVIAAVLPDGLKYAGIYTLAQNMASLVQAPQRAIVAASIGPLSQAWKDKDFAKINRIYHRSSINQLVFAVGMFILIWINFTDGVLTFQLKKGFLNAHDIFLFIGLMRIVDLGTGVNAQIIATSTYWRFEFLTGIILLALTLPLNYFLTKNLGVVGPAISNLFAFSVYNAIRYIFLLRKFNMQPFTIKTLYTLILGIGCYFTCYFLFHQFIGFWWIVLRSSVFVSMYVTGIILMDLSPDVVPVWKTLKKRLLNSSRS
jgi:O-antigen/teichoic acid export membrane protein